MTVSQLVSHLLNLNIDVINNRNFKNRYPSREILHLNDSGSKLLAKNFLEKMKLFWVDRRCSSIIKDKAFEYILKDNGYDNPAGKTGYKENHMEKDEGAFVKFWML